MRNEKQILVSDCSDVVFPAKNLVELLGIRAKEQADKVLYYYCENGLDETSRITFSETDKRAKNIAIALNEIGAKGDRVIMLFPIGIEFITSLYGCLAAGMIAVPAYPPRRNKANERFKSQMDNSEARIIFTNEAIYKTFTKFFTEEDFYKNSTFIIYEQIADGNEASWTDPDIKGDDVALLQYTSGSTGQPKGVMVTHEAIMYNEEFIKRSFGFTQESVGVNWLPNFHDMGLFGALIQAFYLGAQNVIIPPSAFLMNPLNFLKAIKKYGGTTAGGPNFSLDYCLEKVSEEDVKELDFSTLVTFYCGAEPIRKNTFEGFAKHFAPANFKASQLHPVYGMAEVVLIAAGHDYTKEPVYFHANTQAIEDNRVEEYKGEGEERIYVGCGYPIVGTEIAIVNTATKAVCEMDDLGEIWIKGPSVCAGYWNSPDETERTFKSYLADGSGPWMRTGDLGFIREDQLYIAGRTKDLIIIRGRNHYPHDIEHTVEQCHPAIQSNGGAAFSLEINDEERLLLVQELKRTFLRDYDANEIFGAIRQAVAEEHEIQLHHISLVRTGSIPKTTSGKTQRRAAKANYLTDSLGALDSWEMDLEISKQEQRTDFTDEEIKEWLVNWLSRKLGIPKEDIALDKPITAYGLDSLAAVELEKDVNTYFGIEWPLSSFLVETTLENLIVEGKELIKNK